MGFGKFLKKAVKLGGKIAKPLLAQTPIGMAVLKGQQALKSVGSNLKAARLGKIEPVSVQAVAAKIATPLAKRSLSKPRIASRDPRIKPAGTLIGGRLNNGMCSYSDGEGGFYDAPCPQNRAGSKKSSSKGAVYTRGKNKGKKRRVITAPPSAAQLAARARFVAAARARRK